MTKSNKKIQLKNKIINQIMISGNKKTSENLLTKTIKQLQKQSKIQFKNFFQIAIINCMPIFKLNKISNKKRKKKQRKIKLVPSFITNTFSRTFLSIKFITTDLKKKSGESFLNKFKQKLLILSDTKKTSIINQKDEIQKKVVENKRYLKNYRW